MFSSIGICGAGNMGQAIIKGLVTAQVIAPKDIYVYNIHRAKAQQVADTTGITVVDSAEGLAEKSQALIMAVKPNVMPISLQEIAAHISSDTVVISIAAGLTINTLASMLPAGTKIIRSMPNTPAMVGEGMASLTANDLVTEEEKAAAQAVFESFGKAVYVDERLIDAVCGLSGSGPAYVYMFIEALADGAVLEGLPRQMAYTFAAQTVLGAAKMVLETGEHPGKLKDDVCSPGGTTIEAVEALEKGGFRAAAAAAVIASAEKNKTF
ncbi:MAG: pyrroline-5-carboxylate reductase [Megasphaera sp.]|nr:pyrroline-5-carboxylate reductase [Megasphaera sp.]MCI1248164.1 pyrroline-5-carboxylate reductase [Megasphaera sp.]